MKRLARTLISSITPAVLLGLSGCTVHVYGKAGAATGDGTEGAGGEQAQTTPDSRGDRGSSRPAPIPAPAPHKPTPVAPVPHPSSGSSGSVATGGGKAKPAPIDTGAVSGNIKPVKPAPVNPGAVSGNIKPDKPIRVDPGASSGSVVATVPKPDTQSGSSQTGAGGSAKPPKPIDASGVLAGGVKVDPRSPESIAAERVAAEGKRERGDRVLPSGSVASGEKKPKPASISKDKGSAGRPPVDAPQTPSAEGPKSAESKIPPQAGQLAESKAAASQGPKSGEAKIASQGPKSAESKPAFQPPKLSELKAEGSAVAMVPAHGEAKGQMRTPVLVDGLSCSLPVRELKQGAKFKVRGKGFAPGAKVTVGGLAVRVSGTEATEIDAELPAELVNGGDVVVAQGVVVANCGKLTISPAK